MSGATRSTTKIRAEIEITTEGSDRGFKRRSLLFLYHNQIIIPYNALDMADSPIVNTIPLKNEWKDSHSIIVYTPSKTLCV